MVQVFDTIDRFVLFLKRLSVASPLFCSSQCQEKMHKLYKITKTENYSTQYLLIV